MSKKKDTNNKQDQKQEKAPKRSPQRSWKPDRKWIHRGILLLLCLSAIVLSLYWMPAELHYKITQTYVLTVEEPAVVYLKVILPSSNPYQAVSAPEIIWPGIWEVETQGRLDVLRLAATIQKGETAEAEITYQVDLFQGLANWAGEPVRSDDLSPTAVIHSDAPEVLELAATMTRKGDDRATVQNFYTFVQRDADTAAGGPEAQVNQLIALSRAVDIPARPVSGFVLPDNVPFFRTSLEGDFSTDIWSEIQFEGAWHQVDPTRAGAFFRRDLLGWTDGRHLTYDSPTRLAAVLGSQRDEAAAKGAWQVTSSTAFPFTAWADLAAEEGHLTRTVSLQKTWDGRWIMLLATVVILAVLDWMIESDGGPNASVNTTKVKMIKLRFVLIPLLILLLTGCTGPTPTLGPEAGEEDAAAYTLTIEAVSAAENDSVMARGTTTIPEGHCVYTQLFEDGLAVDWWPVGKCYPLLGAEWQFAIPLGEEGAPAALDPAAAYRLEVWWPGAPGDTRAAFEFDLAAPPAP